MEQFAKVEVSIQKRLLFMDPPPPPAPKSRSLFSVGHTYTKKLLFI